MSTYYKHEAGFMYHASCLSRQFLSLLNNERSSDITLVVGTQKFYAHKIILAARCQYFRALLFCGLRESSQNEITLMDTDPRLFGMVLGYIYTGKLKLTGLSVPDKINILIIANRICLFPLEVFVTQHLETVINDTNACMIFQTALSLNLETLIKICKAFLDPFASEIIKSDYFTELNSFTVDKLLDSDSFYAPEIEIFKALKRWIDANPNINHQGLLSKVRFNLISDKDMKEIVLPSGLLTKEEVQRELRMKKEMDNSDLPYRALLAPGENVINEGVSSKVIVGRRSGLLADGSNEPYNPPFIYHNITGRTRDRIVIKLDEVYMLNTFSLEISEYSTERHGFYTEASANGIHWIKIFDSSKYPCRSKVKFSFKTRAVKYIRVTGTKSKEKIFPVNEFSCYYASKPYQMDDGALVPKENIAVISHGTLAYDRNDKLILSILCDYLGSELNPARISHNADNNDYVRLDFSQPYMIDSIRFSIWDKNDQWASYTIEISMDLKNWQCVVDKSKERCGSWQNIYLTRPYKVMHLRIICTEVSPEMSFAINDIKIPILTLEEDCTPSPNVRTYSAVLRNIHESD